MPWCQALDSSAAKIGGLGRISKTNMSYRDLPLVVDHSTSLKG